MPSCSTRKPENYPSAHYPSHFTDQKHYTGKESSHRVNSQERSRRNRHSSRRFSHYIKSDPKTLTVQFTQTRQGLNGREQRVTVQQDFKDEEELESFLKDIENLMMSNRKKKTDHREFVVVEEPEEPVQKERPDIRECGSMNFK
ncbi:hypothetical protein ACOME3_007195 [Neoechinorhynchus agilis]